MIYKISVEFSAYGTVEVEGDSVEDAIKNAKLQIEELPLPDEWHYIDGSYEINDDIFTTKKLNGED